MNLKPDELRTLMACAVEHTFDGVLCMDTEGAILWANPAAARTLETSVDTLVGKTFFQMAPEMNAGLWRELWKEVRVNGFFGFEFQLRVEETVVPMEFTLQRVPSVSRELACVFFRDIEERRRLEKIQQEFVSTASHELRTPMTVIREGVSQVLEGLRGDINESQQRALSMVLGGVDRLVRIMDEFLDMSKIESGKIALRYERLDLSSLLRESAAAFQELAQERGVALNLTLPRDPVWVYLDRDRLVQVLTNLLSNAFKFTEKGTIRLQLTAYAQEVECRVEDTGMGMAAADVDRIFNKFEQLTPVSVTGEKGTGLGLSISRGIVELHHGRIWAESAGAGRGTQMIFTLPILSGAGFFRSQLDPLLREVSRRGGSLTTVIFKIESGDSALLESVIRQCTGRMTDLVVQDPATVYLAISGMVKREGERVVERVLKAYAPHRATVTLAGFPETCADEDRFLEQVLRPETL